MSEHLVPKVVLFDLYGTLIDIRTDEHSPEVWDRLARFLRYRLLPAEPEHLRGAYFSLAKDSQTASEERHAEVDVLGVFKKILSDLGAPGDERFAVEYAHLFRALSMRHFDTFPDTLPALRALRGKFKLGLVSDAQRVFFEPEIRMLGLDALMDAVVVSSDHGFQKPDTRLFAMALGELRVSAGEAVFVGNSIERDIRGAKDAGLSAILLNRNGRHDGGNYSCAPDHVFSTLDELSRWLIG